MKTEVSLAANFITGLLRSSNRGRLSEPQLQHFSHSLQMVLREHYQQHWFPSTPCKGSGYRCIRINHKVDPVIGRAAGAIGLTSKQIYVLLPSELTMWVDPDDVSYRIGENGSIAALYRAKSPARHSLFGESTNRDRPGDRNRVAYKEHTRAGRKRKPVRVGTPPLNI